MRRFRSTVAPLTENVPSPRRVKDQDTSDIFTEVSRGTDKWLWMVEAHAQTGEWAHRSANPERETERQPRH